MNWLSVQVVAGVHTRWLVGVAAFDSHSSALHTRRAVHALSDVDVGNVDVNAVAGKSHTVSSEQMRSDEADGAVDCHSVRAEHCVNGLHVRSDDAPGGTLSYSSARHAVSA